MQQSERSTRTRFKPGERSNLTSSPLLPATGPHAWSGCTTGESCCKRLPSDTCLHHAPRGSRDTRTNNDRPGDPSSRTGHRLVVSNSRGPHASWTHNGYTSSLGTLGWPPIRYLPSRDGPCRDPILGVPGARLHSGLYLGKPWPQPHRRT